MDAEKWAPRGDGTQGEADGEAKPARTWAPEHS